MVEIGKPIAVGIGFGTGDQRVVDFSLGEVLIQPAFVLLQDDRAVRGAGAAVHGLADAPTGGEIPAAPIGAVVENYQCVAIAVGRRIPAVVVGELEDVFANGISQQNFLAVVAEAIAVLTEDPGADAVALFVGSLVADHHRMLARGQHRAGGDNQIDPGLEAHAADIDRRRPDVLQLDELELAIVGESNAELCGGGIRRMVVQFGDAQKLLWIARRTGVGRRGGDAAVRVADGDGLTTRRQLAAVVALDKVLLVAGRRRRPGTEGVDVWREVERQAGGVRRDHGAGFEGVLDGALDRAARYIDGETIGVGDLDILIRLIARGRVELDRSDAELNASWLGSRDTDRSGRAACGMGHVEIGAPFFEVVALEQGDRRWKIAHATVDGSPFGEIQSRVGGDRGGQLIDPRFKMASRDRRARWLELLVHQGSQSPQVHLAGARIGDEDVDHQVGGATAGMCRSPLERVGAAARGRDP